VDFRHFNRETFGSSNKVGFECRTPKVVGKVASGMGYHRVDTAGDNLVDPLKPSYSLSHHEFRAWAMYSTEKMSASLDGILHNFDDDRNPSLNGQSSLYEVVGSFGITPTDDLRISADLAFGSTSVAKSEVKAMVRVEYNFGFNLGKGGK
jgi:hypothetical protein